MKMHIIFYATLKSLKSYRRNHARFIESHTLIPRKRRHNTQLPLWKNMKFLINGTLSPSEVNSRLQPIIIHALMPTKLMPDRMYFSLYIPPQRIQFSMTELIARARARN